MKKIDPNKIQDKKKFNKKISVVIISFLSVILLISSAVNSWPLLTGDINDSFEPKVLNEEYEKIYWKYFEQLQALKNNCESRFEKYRTYIRDTLFI